MKTDLNLSEYKNYYNKNPKARYYSFRGNDSMISDLCDFKMMKYDIPVESFKFKCINDYNNVTNLIRENEQNKIYTSEGLIKTYPSEKFISFFKDFTVKHIKDNLKDIRFCDIDSNDKSTEKIINHVEKLDEKDGVSPMMLFIVPFENENDIEKFSKEIVDLSYVYGYSIASIDTYKHNLMPNVMIKIFQFEAKYTKNKFEFADTLIHVSPLKYLNKIKRNGLVPTSKSLDFKYDNRVYLFNNCYEKYIMMFGQYRTQQLNDDGFCVFKIKSSKLLNSEKYKTGKLKFYIDPTMNFENEKYVQAIFTYGNIDKNLLENEYFECLIDNGVMKKTIKSLM